MCAHGRQLLLAGGVEVARILEPAVRSLWLDALERVVPDTLVGGIAAQVAAQFAGDVTGGAAQRALDRALERACSDASAMAESLRDQVAETAARSVRFGGRASSIIRQQRSAADSMGQSSAASNSDGLQQTSEGAAAAEDAIAPLAESVADDLKGVAAELIRIADMFAQLASAAAAKQPE